MDVYRRYIITYYIQLVMYLCVYMCIYIYPTSVVFVGVYIPTNITFGGTDVSAALLNQETLSYTTALRNCLKLEDLVGKSRANLIGLAENQWPFQENHRKMVV